MQHENLTSDGTCRAFRVGEWTVHPWLDEVSRNGEVIRLEPRTMQLLVRLAQSPGQVVSSQQLLDTVWSGVVVGSASVYQAVSQLRKVLGDTEAPSTYIATIPRKGYRLIAPVQQLDAAISPDTEHRAATVLRTNLRRSPRLLGVAALLVTVLSGTATLLALRNADVPVSHSLPAPMAVLDAQTVAVLPVSAAAHDEPTRTLAPILTDLLRTRLAAVRGLVVVGDISVRHALERHPNAIASALHARYLLQGDVARVGNHVHLRMSLVDATSNSVAWSATFNRPVDQIARINDAIVQRTAESLQLPHQTPVHVSNGAALDLAAYQLYLRGRELMSTFRAVDARKASVIFSRVTTLDPSFARAYCAYGEALLLAADVGAWNLTDQLAAEANKAFDRALELNPELGEAWIQRARLTEDPIVAENLFKRGIQLAPGYDEAYIHYSELLFAQRRRGEALALVDHARRIDPFSAALAWRKSQLIIAIHGDVAAQEQLLHEALKYKPTFVQPLRDLAVSKGLRGGEFAEGIRQIEHAIALEPQSVHGIGIARMLYLDVDDVAAARSVLRQFGRPDDPAIRAQWVAVAQYERDSRRAAELARKLINEWLDAAATFDVISKDARMHSIVKELIAGNWPVATALRDEAIATGDFRTALDLLGRTLSLRTENAPMRFRGLTLTYAHTLMLAGEERRARELLTSLLEHLDAESVGRPAHAFASERAAAFAIVGEDERALRELTASVEAKQLTGWWYTATQDPVYSRIRHDPRFQALVEKALQHRNQQRARLIQMRHRGEVPKRT